MLPTYPPQRLLEDSHDGSRTRPRGTRVGAFVAVVSCLMACLPIAASAVLIATGDGTGNTTPPAADPGFANVGNLGGRSGVYVRNGWVLTASHVGAGTIVLGDVSYDPIPGSTVRFENPDGSQADLLAFKLQERPPLPDLLVTNDPAAVGTLLTIIGRGRNRGGPTTWMGQDGWSWGPGSEIRWGTNRIAQTGNFSLDTETFWVFFDDLPGQTPGQHEADLVSGDSGGAAFVGSGQGAELVGILIGRATYGDQPASTSVFGNGGIIADLYAYRNEVVGVIDRADCDNGIDDDGDGYADYPDDPGCSSATDAHERDGRLICDNGYDDDRDGLIDDEDPGCADPADASERGASFECDNGIDDDGDLLTDYPDDDGCLHPTNPVEAPEPGLPVSLAFGLAGLGALARGRRAPPGAGR